VDIEEYKRLPLARWNLSLEEACDKGRVEVWFDSDEWGWPSEGGPLNPVRGYISRSVGPTRVFILLRRRDSSGGFPIDADHIFDIRPIGWSPRI
jgi:hypothetical protein